MEILALLRIPLVRTRDHELAVAVYVAMIFSGNHRGKNGKITQVL